MKQNILKYFDRFDRPAVRSIIEHINLVARQNQRTLGGQGKVTKRMNGYISKCKSEACRLMPVFGLLFIALAGFCLTGVFAESQNSVGDGTSPVAASLNRNSLVNGGLFQNFSNAFPTLAPRSPHWSNTKSNIKFGAVGEDKFNPKGAGNRFRSVNGNQSLFK